MRWSCKSPVRSTTSSEARAQTSLAHSRKTESKVVSCCVACGSLASVRACPCQSTRRCILWGRVDVSWKGCGDTGVGYGCGVGPRFSLGSGQLAPSTAKPLWCSSSSRSHAAAHCVRDMGLLVSLWGTTLTAWGRVSWLPDEGAGGGSQVCRRCFPTAGFRNL